MSQIRKDFEKAFEAADFGQDHRSNLIPEEQAALWAAKWMAERIASDGAIGKNEGWIRRMIKELDQ